MNPLAAAVILTGTTILVGLVVWCLLEARRITHPRYKRDNYGLTPDDAPRDDNDWPPEQPVTPRRINGDH